MGEVVVVVGSAQAGKRIGKKASNTKKEKHGKVKVDCRTGVVIQDVKVP